MKKAEIYYGGVVIGFPCGLVGEKLYINDKENGCVSAVKVTKILVKLGTCNSDGGISGNFPSVMVAYNKATEKGVICMSSSTRNLSLYANAYDAANDVNKIYPLSLKKRATNVRLGHCSVWAAFESALSKTPLSSIASVRNGSFYRFYGTYVWDGLKPIFKTFDLNDNFQLVFTEEDGWNFDKDYFDGPNDEMYRTEEECRAAHSIKVFEFAEDF